jgi:hypothetical protein
MIDRKGQTQTDNRRYFLSVEFSTAIKTSSIPEYQQRLERWLIDLSSHFRSDAMWNHLPNPLADLQRIWPKSLTLFSIESRPPYQFEDSERDGWTSKNTVHHPFHMVTVRLSSGKNGCRFRSLPLEHLASSDDGQLSVDKWWGGSSPSSLWLRIGLSLHVHVDQVEHKTTTPLFSLVSSPIVLHAPLWEWTEKARGTFLSVHYDFVSSNNGCDNTLELKIKTVFG